MEMMNKKGIFFIMLALVAITLLFVTYTFYIQFENRKDVEERVKTMSSFLDSVEQDTSRQLYILGFRTLFLIEQSIVESGSYASNTNSTFQEAFFNGTYKGAAEVLLIGSTKSDIESNAQSLGEKINVNISFAVNSIDIRQENPWFVILKMNANISLVDKGGLASWNRSTVINASIPITAFEDPLFTINTNNKISRKFIKTGFYPFVSGSTVTNLSNHAQLGLYYNNSAAPSFLQRLEGNLAANPQGIESFVNPQNLSQQGITVQPGKTLIDYIYFSGNNPTSYSVTGMPVWFRIDNSSGHLEVYQVSSLASS